MLPRSQHSNLGLCDRVGKALAERLGCSPLSRASRVDSFLKYRYCTRSLSGHTDWVRCVASSRDGAWLASAGNDQHVRVWNALAQWQCACVLSGHEHVIEAIAWAPGAALSTLPAAPAPPEALESAPQPPAAAAPAEAAGAPRADTLATGSRDKTVRLWQVSTSQCVMMFSHDNWVRSIAWHASSKFLISASDDRTIRVFDLKAGRRLRTMEEAHSHFVTSIALHANGLFLVSGGVDQIVKLWACK